jgi:hypothetical protein
LSEAILASPNKTPPGRAGEHQRQFWKNIFFWLRSLRLEAGNEDYLAAG